LPKNDIDKGKGKDTKIVTTGRRRDWTMGAVNPVVVHASTVLFDTVAELREAGQNKTKNFFYGRRGSPTSFALCEAMTDLEGGGLLSKGGTVLYPSGLSAITASILAFVKAGDHILVPDNAYDPTRHFCDTILKRYGVETSYYDPLAGTAIKALLRPNSTVVMVESPGSITMEVQDIPAIAKAAHENGAIVIADNTWATGYFYRPLELGADISLLAATKYISGHSDVMLGTATANERCFQALQEFSGTMGYCVGPDDIYLGLRGLRTLGVRLKQHQQSALEMANWLKARPEVDRVLYPALPDCPGHALWRRDFSGASGLFSIVLKSGSDKAVVAMLDGLSHFGMGFSWGGFESLILSYPWIGKMRTATTWPGPGPILRLHIGLENVEDLKADLEAGFSRFNAAL
jgi:cystathionine beta-lyase